RRQWRSRRQGVLHHGGGMRVLVGVIGVGGTGAGARAVLAGIVEHHHLVHRHEPFVLYEIGATDRVRRLQRGLTAHDEQGHRLTGGHRAGAMPHRAVGDPGQGDRPLQGPPRTQGVLMRVRVHGPSFSSSCGLPPVTSVVPCYEVAPAPRPIFRWTIPTTQRTSSTRSTHATARNTTVISAPTTDPSSTAIPRWIQKRSSASATSRVPTSQLTTPAPPSFTSMIVPARCLGVSPPSAAARRRSIHSPMAQATRLPKLVEPAAAIAAHCGSTRFRITGTESSVIAAIGIWTRNGVR